jgi:DNA-binding MarR family transcriptional regulator
VLSDTERKLLRILWNQNGLEWFRPDLKQLCRMSQRNFGQVKAAVRGLIAQGYIEVRDDRLRVVAVWELKRRLL